MSAFRNRRWTCAGLVFWAGLMAFAAGCATTRPGGDGLTETPEEGPVTTEIFLYHVQRGDSLYSLGRRFGVSWQRIAEENGIDDPADMRVGRPLFIPRAEGVTPPDPGVPARTPAERPRRAVEQADLHRGQPAARFWWPTAGNLLRRYGQALRGLPEPGIAIGASAGMEVCAVASGTVVTCVSADQNPGSAWGNVLAVSHADRWVSWYAHLDRMLVAEGERVSKGQPIATVGSTGAADQPQLAFRLFHNARPVDPIEKLP